MRSAAHQKFTTPVAVKIACSRERLKKMIAAAQGCMPDDPVEEGSSVKQWELIGDDEITMFVNFANIFLYTGNAVIQVVDVEPAPRLIETLS